MSPNTLPTPSDYPGATLVQCSVCRNTVPIDRIKLRKRHVEMPRSPGSLTLRSGHVRSWSAMSARVRRSLGLGRSVGEGSPNAAQRHYRIEQVPVCVDCIHRRRDLIVGLVAVGGCVAMTLALYLRSERPAGADNGSRPLQPVSASAEQAQPPPPTDIMKLRNDGYSNLLARQYGSALSLFRQASDLGDAYAPMYIGYLYENGLGVRRNASSALGWYRTAQSRGNAQATTAIARLSRGPK